ncbi:Os03g0302850 [Oryza sativa Japonica Group]|uniref:Os03g0302850 protein n=1 Tax=Oryza sativa subsp. japonica TaxID=39947 RepID=A0A0P0VXA9_ORYSJ|nr:Os03g0302850 [Oryza sativa Japonica Group]
MQGIRRSTRADGVRNRNAGVSSIEYSRSPYPRRSPRPTTPRPTPARRRLLSRRRLCTALPFLAQSTARRSSRHARLPIDAFCCFCFCFGFAAAAATNAIAATANTRIQRKKTTAKCSTRSALAFA